MENESANQIHHYWEEFLATQAPDSPYHQRRYQVEKWGDTPEMANELGALIASGVKTAACSSVWEIEAEKSPQPEVGWITMVVDWEGEPLCIIETIEVEVKPFNRVDEEFAFLEGEGDRSLKYWRDAHWRYFTRTLGVFGLAPAEEMPVICERFRVIYKE